MVVTDAADTADTVTAVTAVVVVAVDGGGSNICGDGTGGGGGACLDLSGMTTARAQELLDVGIEKGVAKGVKLALVKIQIEGGAGALVVTGGSPTTMVTI